MGVFASEKESVGARGCEGMPSWCLVHRCQQVNGWKMIHLSPCQFPHKIIMEHVSSYKVPFFYREFLVIFWMG